jgi:hypothetical protein
MFAIPTSYIISNLPAVLNKAPRGRKVWYIPRLPNNRLNSAWWEQHKKIQSWATSSVHTHDEEGKNLPMEFFGYHIQDRLHLLITFICQWYSPWRLNPKCIFCSLPTAFSWYPSSSIGCELLLDCLQGCLSRRHDVLCRDGPLCHDTIGST